LSLILRFGEVADSGLLQGKRFRVGYGECWLHAYLEAGQLTLATIDQQPDSEAVSSIQSWLQV
jgi:hypothetical protein